MNATTQQQMMAQALVLGARAALTVQQPEQAEVMREAIAALWPECPDLVELQAMVLYLTNRTGEALALLHERTDTRSLALKAACLSRLQHPDWREPLQEVLTREDDEWARTFAYKMFDIEGEPAPASVHKTVAETDSTDRFSIRQGVRA